MPLSRRGPRYVLTAGGAIIGCWHLAGIYIFKSNVSAEVYLASNPDPAMCDADAWCVEKPPPVPNCLLRRRIRVSPLAAGGKCFSTVAVHTSACLLA